ncbi:hypothetical protein BDN67DRAFT_1072748 [Paxillus ammoniavirescens]|nr:hypothetical protein BDN67DRAFT_1072748 [Paxillus ammoniavirescens]
MRNFLPPLEVISEVFRAFIPRLETYQPYLVKLEFVATLIDSLVHDGKSDFGDFINLQEASERCRGWSLEKYLIEPVNRLAQYPELFRRLLHLTPKTHPDYLSTLSLFHAAKLTIRVLSEVKDREDAYELVKVACARVRGVPSVHLAKRERRLLMRGPLTCVEVNSDEQVLAPNHGQHSPRSDVPPSQRHRRADKLSQAVRDWRGRSNSVKSTASTVASFSTAPSSFDVRMGQPANVVGTPIVRVESEPLDVEVFVFTDLVLLASPLDVDHHAGEGTEECSMEPLEGFGLSRILSVLDEIDRRSCITLDLVPLTCQELEEGHVHSSGPVVTIALSQCTSVGGRTGLGEWLPPFRQCCQYTLKSLSSLSTKGFLVHGTTSEPEMQKPVLSILASGLPFPKSPSMQIEESQHGRVVDSEQEEREERGWWSKRFHEVFFELSKQDVPQC